ncbi:MAG: hypothetical protein ACQEQH_09085, partial [Bacillota bacterium]
MKYKKIVLFMLIFILLFTISAMSKSKITYYTTIEENSDQIHVKVKLEDLKQDKVIIGLPNLPQEASDHDSFTFQDHLHNFKAYNGNKEFEIEQKDDLLFINANSDLTYLEYSVDNKIYS